MRFLILILIVNQVQAGYKWCGPLTFDVHPASTLTNPTRVVIPTGTAISKFKDLADGGAATSILGYDIGLFSDSTCTASMAYQLVPGTYDGTTGIGEFWVKLPSQSSSIDTVIYAGVGNPLITTDQSTLNTFPTSISARVWHLQSIDGISPFTSADSTPNSPTGDINNIPAVSVLDAKISKGFTQSTTGFAGASGTTGIPVGQVPLALSCWVKTSTINASHADVINYANIGNTQEFGVWIKTDGSTCTADWSWFVSFGACSSTTTIRDGAYHYVVGTFDGTSTSKIYIDGVLKGTDTLTVPTIPTDFSGLKLFQQQTSASHVFIGDLDDCRVWNVAPTADYIAAEYANQSDPTTYYTFGTFVEQGSSVKHRAIQ